MNEKSRQSLVRKLEGVLGPEDALTLMASLPPIPWSDLATKQDLNDLRAATKQDLNDLRAATKQDLNDLRAANEKDLAGLEERMGLRMEAWGMTLRTEIFKMSQDLTMTMVTTFQAQTRNLMIALVGTMTAFTGVVFGALRII